MRLVTRADFDGLVCGALVKKFEQIEDYLFVEPKFMQDGLVEIRSGDIITNLPYHPNCTLWFDHHITNTMPDFPKPIMLGKGGFRLAPSAARVLNEARVVFLFAPSFHPAMKHAAPARRELGTPSIMNLLGPLANPAGVKRQVIGVAERDRAAIVAEALVRLGAEHALVVHGRVGMDEISPYGATDVWEVKDGTLRTWEIDPERYRLSIGDVDLLQGGEPAANAERLERILGNGSGDPPGLAAVLLNAGAAIYVAGIAGSLAEGIGRAREVVASGAARAALDRLRKATASISG